ncbi:hypothetical protein C8C83_2941 [Flavobacterium sp. 90]|uniref:hypothetical protein n=1 Tax=unclassified Flavobacterium TaxID=196869 RepID=UPI000EB23C29|nr:MULTISPECIES: hypothetical protein [unclassified Flavobacterium]RKR11237.1 hypothetical protein C8C82_3251 [Flavobacterium sp. 81]TCK55018.1 hypothetical protein C8C83_2941 [Flavobacterium sp. 90]
MKSIIFILISFLIISCRTNSKLRGEYQANLSDSTNYTFNLSAKQYTHKWPSGKFSKGKFKILDLSSKKKLLVCNEFVLIRVNGIIKEASGSGDSINIGTYSGYKNFGATVFEITSKEKTLQYRKTYANDLKKTESEGVMLKMK